MRIAERDLPSKEYDNLIITCFDDSSKENFCAKIVNSTDLDCTCKNLTPGTSYTLSIITYKQNWDNNTRTFPQNPITTSNFLLRSYSI